jgi:trimeric autotransporter adhesin
MPTTHLAPASRRAILLALLAVALAACGGGDAEGTAPPVAGLQRVEASPSTATLPRGAALRLTLTAVFDAGSPQDVTAKATWTSSAPAIASVSGGLVTAVKAGTATVSAAYEGKTTALTVTVTPPALVSVQVDPAALALPMGTRRAFTATGVYSDGGTADLTPVAAWTSSAPSLGALRAGAAPGTLEAIAEGTATLTAAHEGVSGTAAVTVTAPALVEVRVEPPAAQVPAGLDTAFTATGVYSDGSTADLTVEALWVADGGGAIFPGGAPAGTARGLTPGGPLAVRAFVPGAAVVGEASLLVTEATPVSVDVTPAAAVLAKGLTRAFVATAVFSDGSHADVTSQAVWTVSDDAVATASSAPATAGLVAAVAPGGPVTVTATLAGTGVSGEAALTVTTAEVAAVEITPAVASLAAGEARAFRADAAYTDGARVNVTENATWSSSDPGIASVSNAPGARGRATGLRAGGPLALRATLAGIAAQGVAELTITSAALTALAVEPATVRLPKGTGTRLRAFGTYADGTTRELTAAVTWTSADPAAVPVTTGTGGAGVVTAATSGADVEITAAVPGTSVTATASVTTTPAALAALEVGPAASTVALGRSQAFTATGTFTDGTGQDLSDQVSWLSSDAAVATVSNALAAAGVAQTRGEGTAEIVAWFPGSTVTASSRLTVGPPDLVGVDVSPALVQCAKGRTVQLAATGRYTDGVDRPLTATAAWASQAPAITAVAATPGAFRCALPGNGQVTATAGGLDGIATFAVGPAVLDALAVSPDPVVLDYGARTPLTIEGVFSDGTTSDASVGASVQIANPDVLRLEPGPVLVGAGLGTTTIVVTGENGVAATVPARVNPILPSAIAIVPGVVFVPVSGALSVRAFGTFPDGTVADVTQLATWTSSDPAVAEAGPAGQLLGRAPGTVSVSATFGATGVASVTVQDGPAPTQLAGLRVEAPAAPFAPGGAAQLRAVASLVDGSERDVTSLVGWTSSAPGVATVDALGVVRGVARGRAVVTAVEPEAGLTASSAVTVYDGAAPALAIRGPASLLASVSAQLRAVVPLPEGDVDVTDRVTWLVLTPGGGSFDASRPGALEASGPEVRVSAMLGEAFAEATFPVASEPADVRIVPRELRLGVGRSGIVRAYPVYPGAQREEYAEPATCQSDHPNVFCAPSGDSAGTWECTAGATGVGTVTCSVGDRVARIPMVVSPFPPQPQVVDLAVRDAQWIAAALELGLDPFGVPPEFPESPRRAGGTAQFFAIGAFDDGNVGFVDAAWSVTDPRLATSLGGGTFSFLRPGELGLIATSSGVTGIERVAVLPAVASTGLTLTGPSRLFEGERATFTAEALGPGGPLAVDVALASSDPAVVRVDPAAPGRVLATGGGTATITATARDGRTAIASVSVVGVFGLRILPDRLVTTPGSLGHVQAFARLEDGREVDVTAFTTWSADDPAVLATALQLPGQWLAIGSGATVLRAGFDGLEASALFEATPEPPPPGPAGLRIDELPDLLVGETAVAHAVAYATDGSLRSASVTFTVENPAVASLDPSRVLTAVAPGTTTLTATDGVQTDTAPVRVTSLASLRLSPHAPVIALGEHVSLLAEAVDALGNVRPLPGPLTCTAGSAEVAAIESTGEPEGCLAFGVGEGVTQVTAASAGLTGAASLTVVAPRIERLFISPPNLVIELGAKVPLRALAARTGGALVDVSATASWRAHDPAVASFEPTDASGTITGQAVGITAVSATTVDGGAAVTGVGTVDVRAGLEGLLVDAPDATAVGFTVFASARAVWLDGTTTVMNEVTWTSTDPSVLEVVPDQPGAFRGLRTGAVVITATSPGGVTGSVQLEVRPSMPTEIVLSPASATADPGDRMSFTATATYSDGTTRDVTALATWSGTAGLALVSPGVFDVTAYTGAPVRAEARMDGPAGPVIGSTEVRVTAPPAFVEVARVAPEGEVLDGDVVRFQATLTRYDGSTEDATAIVSFTFHGATATATGVPGEFTISGLGFVSVEAMVAGLSGWIGLDVFPAPTGFAILGETPPPFTLVPEQLLNVNARLDLSDGSNFNMALVSTWWAADPAVVYVTPASILGIAPGTTTVTVELEYFGRILTATAEVTVVAARLEILPADAVTDPNSLH